MPNIRRRIKIETIEKIVQSCPGVDLPRLAVKLGNPVTLQPHVRDALLAAMFDHPDQVRMCCDRFGCSPKTRQGLMETPVNHPSYEKMQAIAISKTPIRIYPAFHCHPDTPLLRPGQSGQGKCIVWVDPSEITFSSQRRA